MIRSIAAVSLLVAALASAQETVLVPVLATAQIHGANNTAFQTRLFVGTEFVNPGQVAPLVAGRFLQVESGADIFYELDITGPDGSLHRTTVPVARERNFKRGRSAIVGLTTGPKYDFSGGQPPRVVGFHWRNRLRIYDADNSGTLHVRVRVVIEALRAYGPFLDADVAVNSRDANDPTYPFYADVPLSDLCITAPTGNICNEYGYTVTLEPSNAATRYWAFASATDNDTGETSLFFAQ